MSIETSVEDLTKAAHEGDAAKRAESNEEAERASLSKCNFFSFLSDLDECSGVALEPDKGVGSVSGPVRTRLLAKERRPRLLYLTRKAFPKGKKSKIAHVSGDVLCN